MSGRTDDVQYGRGVEASRFAARAVVTGCAHDAAWIARGELERARHALAYLKSKIGDEQMRRLLADDIAQTMMTVCGWVESSGGRWQSAQIELVLTGPPAAEFHAWYNNAMAHRCETALRAGHPEHFVLAPRISDVEVVENIGESPLPWQVFYRSLSEHEFPVAWGKDWPVRFGAELVDEAGSRVGYTMHQARDADDGMHMLLRTLLPEAAPADLVQRHLRHFAIEFTNWAHIAWSEAQNDEGIVQ